MKEKLAGFIMPGILEELEKDETITSFIFKNPLSFSQDNP